jgi:hypothetical protein
MPDVKEIDISPTLVGVGTIVEFCDVEMRAESCQ